MLLLGIDINNVAFKNMPAQVFLHSPVDILRYIRTIELSTVHRYKVVHSTDGQRHK
jgi:hypothetical protein